MGQSDPLMLQCSCFVVTHVGWRKLGTIAHPIANQSSLDQACIINAKPVEDNCRAGTTCCWLDAASTGKRSLEHFYSRLKPPVFRQTPAPMVATCRGITPQDSLRVLMMQQGGDRRYRTEFCTVSWRANTAVRDMSFFMQLAFVAHS